MSENIPTDEVLQETTSTDVISSTELQAKKPKKNNLLLLANAILLIGLVVLYVLFFFGNKHEKSLPEIAKASSGSVSIACVNSDSILEHYELVKVMRQQLESAQKNKETELGNLKRAFDKKVADYQQKVSSNSLTPQLAKLNEEQLLKEQQNLMSLQEKYTNELSQQEMNLNIQLLDSITNFLKRYNLKYKFDYILNIKKGGDVFLSNKTMDITGDVLKELNTEYKANQQK
jgi:outer membrane protein